MLTKSHSIQQISRRFATYKVHGKNVGAHKSVAQIGKHEVCTDLPSPASHGEAPQPVEVFLAALIGMRFYAQL
jgi:hypothetical protein